MFIQDLRNDFFNILVGKRILVIVNYDIDGICASKILQALFKYDNMLYSVVPIMGITGLQRAFNENKSDIKYTVLINCGGCIDIVEVLQPEDDIIFFVCDAHRPMDVCNIYSDSQIRILGDINSSEGIPEFDKIFRDDDDIDGDDDADDDGDDNEADADGEVDETGEEDDHHGSEQNNFSETNKHRSDSNGIPRTKRNRTDRYERQIAKRREKQKWEENRNKIMFDYSQYSYYGKSSAIVIFELAWKLSKDSMDLLWWAIVGITEQLILGKIDSAVYVFESDRIKSHVSRLVNRINDANNGGGSNNNSTSTAVQTTVRINFEQDLHLALYRHWNVYDSLKHSMYSSCKLKLWTLRGEKRLHELLVEMGLPLAQANQQFTAMDLILRKEFFQMIEKVADKYDLPDIIYGSYTLQYGYRNRYSAADYVYGMLAILESIKKDRTPEHCFLEALDSLTRTNKSILDGGIERAKQYLSVIFKQVQQCLAQKQIHSAGPFLYYVLQEENPYFSCPYGLLMLAKFMLHGHVAISRSRRAQELPLIVSCPIDIERDLCLLIGIPPVCEDSPKHFFGKAFEQAAINSKAIISQDFFETSIIQIKQSDLTKFLDGLTVLLS